MSSKRNNLVQKISKSGHAWFICWYRKCGNTRSILTLCSDSKGRVSETDLRRHQVKVKRSCSCLRYVLITTIRVIQCDYESYKRSRLVTVISSCARSDLSYQWGRRDRLTPCLSYPLSNLWIEWTRTVKIMLCNVIINLLGM